MISRRGCGLVGVVAAVVLLCACAAAATTYWAVGSSLRCEIPEQGPVQPGWSARTVVSDDRERCYHLYVPPGYDPSEPAPVVVSMHGFLSNPNSQAAISGWHRLADREGFLVVYPQGTSFPKRWNAGVTWGAAPVDDVQFFRRMLDDLSTVAAVDRSRVYVNGLSNGGGMAVRIACEASEQVAAIGLVAAAVVGLENCNPSRPVPAMAFHGTADPVVPYEGGDMRGHVLPWGADLTDAPVYFVGAEEWAAIWAMDNGCNPTPAVIPTRGDVRGVQYASCDQDAVVILYTIVDGGHTWPGGAPIPGVGKTSTDIDASEEMWRFFEAYRLGSER
jgi:polyhydroxybutyrate depolymerase